MSPSLAAILAHQGGWDEILLIVGPMAVVVLLLRLAKRRVDANLGAATPTTNTTAGAGMPAAPDPATGSDLTGGSPGR